MRAGSPTLLRVLVSIFLSLILTFSFMSAVRADDISHLSVADVSQVVNENTNTPTSIGGELWISPDGIVDVTEAYEFSPGQLRGLNETVPYWDNERALQVISREDGTQFVSVTAGSEESEIEYLFKDSNLELKTAMFWSARRNMGNRKK